ncbi:MAG: hypothetical protein ACJ8H8_34135 [Geminicoccaceae bacterium]
MAEVRIHDIDEARRAIDRARETGDDVVLVTAPGSAAFTGVGYWRALSLAVGRPVVIDCGDDAGLAMGALRAGARDLLFTGPEALAVKLDDLAIQIGAQVRRLGNG